MSSTSTSSYTYTTTDIEKVVRRLRADLKMIAQNSGGMTETEASEYSDDIELLAKNGFLKKVDVTLMSGSQEVRAAVYTVNDAGGGLSAANPGGVFWPRVDSPHVRLVISYSDKYTTDERARLKEKLKVNWSPTSADTSHSELKAAGGRDYMSNGWAMQRKDFSK